jgi:6-phosphogluconolactonase
MPSASNRPDPGGQSYYAALGSELVHVRVGADGRTLERHGSVSLPGRLQYGWWHSHEPLLYAACTTREPGARDGGTHGLTAIAVDRATGEPQQVGPWVDLPARPIHLTSDSRGYHLLVTYNEPAGVSVHPLDDDGVVLTTRTEPTRLPATSYPHQSRVDPSGRWVLVVARGNSGHGLRPQSPGALHVFDLDDGVLQPRQTLDLTGRSSITQFNPRHLDFHPTLPVLYLTLEAQNRMLTLGWDNGLLADQPIAHTDTMLRPPRGPRQLCGTVHVHPSGRSVYCANRSDGIELAGGESIGGGGRSSIAAYSVDPSSGCPTLIQDADTRGVHPRTFQIDPGGALLLAANMRSVPAGGPLTADIPARLTLFSIAGGGTIDYLSHLDFPGTEELLFWVGGPHVVDDGIDANRHINERTDRHEHASPVAPEQHSAR